MKAEPSSENSVNTSPIDMPNVFKHNENENEYPHVKCERTETDERQNICRILQWITDVEKESV